MSLINYIPIFVAGGGGISTDPGESNVLINVDYEINGVPKVGTLVPVTNNISCEAVLIGQDTDAVLTGE